MTKITPDSEIKNQSRLDWEKERLENAEKRLKKAYARWLKRVMEKENISDEERTGVYYPGF